MPRPTQRGGGIGDAYSLATGALGYDPIAGISLTREEQAIAMAGGLLPLGGFHLLGRLAKLAPELGVPSRVSRLGDDALRVLRRVVGEALQALRRFGGAVLLPRAAVPRTLPSTQGFVVAFGHGTHRDRRRSPRQARPRARRAPEE